jgi:ABC-2 type transport system ATP-binding protein
MKNLSLIEIRNVSKYFGKTKVLDNISFNIPENSIIGILGPNGSGKSTLMRIIAGLIRSWEGEILFEGQPVRDNNRYLHRLGFLIEDPAFYEHLTADENLKMLARLTESPITDIVSVLEKVNLRGCGDKLVHQFSYGMKQRLGIAQSILNDPSVIFLDEPSNGLDPHGIIQMNNIIRGLNKQGKTICISTHVIEQVKELCSHIVILKEGGIILNDSVQNLLSRSTKYEMESSNIQNTKQKLSSIEDLVIVHETKTKLIVDSKLSLSQMFKTLHTDSALNGINKQLDITKLFS